MHSSTQPLRQQSDRFLSFKNQAKILATAFLTKDYTPNFCYGLGVLNRAQSATWDTDFEFSRVKLQRQVSASAKESISQIVSARPFCRVLMAQKRPNNVWSFWWKPPWETCTRCQKIRHSKICHQIRTQFTELENISRLKAVLETLTTLRISIRLIRTQLAPQKPFIWTLAQWRATQMLKIKWWMK